MNVYKVELMIIDHDELGADEIKLVLENARYPNRCIHPEVKSVEGRGVGKWTDDHPMNNFETADAEYHRMFSKV